MLKIDTHTHIIPKDLPKFKDKFGYGGFISLEHGGDCTAKMMRDDGTFFREIGHNCWDPKQRLSECDNHGVNVQVLSTVPVLFSYWAEPKDTLEVAKYLNDHIAAVVAAHPKRFVGLGTLPMQAPELAAKELERCLRQGLKGIQIGTHVNGWNLDSPEIFAVLAAAADLGAAVFVHPWDMLGKERMQKYWLPWLVGMPAETSIAICSLIFGGVLERLPNLRINFAHGGGSFPATLGRIEHGFKVRPDLCAINNNVNPRSYIGRFYVDSLVHDKVAFHYLLSVLGSKSIVLGSDYPFPLGEHEPGALVESLDELTPAAKADILCHNALNWLQMQASDFK